MAILELGHVVAGHALKEGEGPRSDDVHLAHVRHIEKTRRATHGEMLLDHTEALAGVIDGHVPSAEGNHFGAGSDMLGVEGSLEKQGGSPWRRG